MTNLTTLRERVEAAEGPDRELDALLMALAYTRDVRFIGAWCEGCDCPNAPRHKDPVWVDPATDQWVSTTAYEYTASVDRALALAERILPGSLYEIKALPARLGHGASLWSNDPAAERMLARADAPTPALALLSALLSAIQNKEQTNDAG